jgi:hypothetical protein
MINTDLLDTGIFSGGELTILVDYKYFTMLLRQE